MDGWGDCNGLEADGCESDLANDPQKCGACGNDCQGRFCFESACVPRKVLAGSWWSAAVVRPDGMIRIWGKDGPGIPISWDAIVDFGPVVSIALAPGVNFRGLIALRADGTVATSAFPAPPAGLDQVVKIAAGGSTALALRRDGTVVAWTSALSSPVVTDLPSDLGEVIDLAAGEVHGLAVRKDGTVVAWGNDDYGQASVPAGLQDVIQVAAFGRASLALRADGTVAAWGIGKAVTSLPSDLDDVVQIAAGGFGGAALLADGTVRAWGDAAVEAVPPGLSNVVAIAGGGRQVYALRDDGSVVGWGSQGYPEFIPFPTGLTAMLP